MIEVPAAVREAAESGPLLAACSGIISQGDCVLSPGNRAAIAIVSFSDEAHLSARLEVRLRAADGGSAATESLVTFAASDPEEERWQSLGLLIGARVSQLQVRAEAEAPSVVPPYAPKAPAVRGAVKLAIVDVQPVSAPDTFRMRVGPSLGFEFTGAVAYGVVAEFAARVDWLELRSSVGFSRAEHAVDVSVERIMLAAGLGLPLFELQFGLQGRAFVEVGPEFVRASAFGSEGDRLTGLGRAGLDLSYDLDWFSAGLTTSAQREWSKTNVTVNGARVVDGSVYSLQWAALLGASF